jgi:acyl-CoA reductase-like NAD-dependent aldehyde dehydrogenase
MGSIESAGSPATGYAQLDAVFARLRAAQQGAPNPSRAARAHRLASLQALLQANVEEIALAIDADFGHRSLHETRLLEIFPSLEAVKHARRHLRAWMRRERRPVSLWFQPGRAFVERQPLGVVGIVVPWNYPVYLAIGPLVAALAAGNRVMIKMSEFTPRTAELLARLAAAHFAPDEVAIVQGEAAIGEAFCRLPFDHLLFTGSTRVGHSVMRAAAENLTPVTLELGGKSPAIVAPGYPLAHAAERILVGKCLNAGQTCIAPDYVLLPAGEEAAFLESARAFVARGYPELARTPDYSAIVNQRHFERLAGYVDEARALGAEIVPLSADLPAPDGLTRRFPPTALLRVPDTAAVMHDEIFGPLLPIVSYRSIDEAIAYVNARPRPLALYLFDREPVRVERVLRETVTGGVTVNDTILHIAQDALPFGGVGPSGMGHYHGREGFDTFSKCKGVFVQARVNTIPLFRPPYGRLFDALVRMLLR